MDKYPYILYTMATKQRDISIDILKFFAALLITNSHIGLLYPENIRVLSTGGAIGDVFFFFCSGYTLFLGVLPVSLRGGESRLNLLGDFANWYKRRINRIYPTLFAWALMSCVLFGNHSDILTIVLKGGGWFVSCIMIYYVVLWFVKNFAMRFLKMVLMASVGVSVLWYYTLGLGDWASGNIYGETYFKWCFFFMYMLLGAIVGLKRKEGKLGVVSQPVKDLIMLIISVALSYAFFYFKKYDNAFNAIQMLSWFPLMGVCWYMYKVCNANIMTSLFRSKHIGWCMKFISGLCLEIYLVQYTLARLDWVQEYLVPLFPLNLLLFFMLILFTAYILRCLARIWGQTFHEADYDWRSVVKFL